jgi:spermidine synthase
MKKIVLLSFCLSGMAALIYEVVWMRQLTLIFGTTVYAISTVLAVFMAGLALGSLVLGRVADRSKNPLRLYAFLQGGIGIYVLLIPLLFNLINSLQIYLARGFALDFSGFSLIRFGLCFLVLLIPTTLMGGTLPVIVRFFVRRKEELGGYLGRLYSLNTLGGVFGSFLAGFVLILLLGVRGTIYLAAAINLSIAAGVFLLSQRTVLAPAKAAANQRTHSRQKESPTADSSRIAWLVLILFGFSGFAALSLEASWSRVLAMILGSSVYAFSIILTTFLLGIAFGSWLISKFVDRLKNLLTWFTAIEIALGLSVILLTPLFGYLPYLFLRVFRMTGGSFWSLQFMEFLLAAAVMLIPTVLMGAAFPIVTKICTAELGRLGRSVGNVYFANTLGAILGPLATGFLFIPVFGLQRSILIAAFVYLAIGAVILILSPPKRLPVRVCTFSLLVMITTLSFLIPDWNRNILNSAVYVHAREYLKNNRDDLLGAIKEQASHFYKEGLSATVAVRETKTGHLALLIDGKADAGTQSDMKTQLILGHLPMLLHEDPQQVLVVGLGSGVTLGAVQQHQELKEVDMVEIEPAVAEAAAYFSEYNHNALSDPRLNLIIEDGRNYVLITDKKYDVITAEPSNPWMTGNANLFTREQFELYKKRLKPGGIMFQWLHAYKLRPQDVKTIVATFEKVFPHAVLWQGAFSRDLFLVGTEQPLSVDFAAFAEKMARAKIKQDLAQVHLDDPFLLLSFLLFNEQAVRNFSKGAPIHTDNHPILEFQAPKGIFLPPGTTTSATLKALEQWRSDIFTILQEIDDEALAEKIALYARSRTHSIQGDILLCRGEPLNKVIAEYQKALSLVPDIVLIEKCLAEFLFTGGEIVSGQKLYQEAEDLFRQAIAHDPSRRHFYQALAEVYIQQDDRQGAIGVYQQALAVEPNDIDFRLKSGVLHAITNDLEKAEQEFLFVLRQDKNSYRAHNNLANIYRLRNMKKKALAHLQRSLAINPNQSEIKALIKKR